MKITKKIIATAAILLITSIFTTSLCVCAYDGLKNAKELQTKLLRLHIKANSDSAEDQELKLKVRDAVLDCAEELFNGLQDADEAGRAAAEHLETLKAAAISEIQKNGYSYDVDIKIEKTYFPTKTYDNIVLPAGTYNALNIKIGAAAGQNWWCVLYPPVCLSGSIHSDKITDAVSGDASDMIKKDKKIKIKFKIAEIVGKIGKKKGK